MKTGSSEMYSPLSKYIKPIQGLDVQAIDSMQCYRDRQDMPQSNIYPKVSEPDVRRGTNVYEPIPPSIEGRDIGYVDILSLADNDQEIMHVFLHGYHRYIGSLSGDNLNMLGALSLDTHDHEGKILGFITNSLANKFFPISPAETQEEVDVRGRMMRSILDIHMPMISLNNGITEEQMPAVVQDIFYSKRQTRSDISYKVSTMALLGAKIYNPALQTQRPEKVLVDAKERWTAFISAVPTLEAISLATLSGIGIPPHLVEKLLELGPGEIAKLNKEIQEKMQLPPGQGNLLAIAETVKTVFNFQD